MINRREIEKLLFKISTFDDYIRKTKEILSACHTKELEENLMQALKKYAVLKDDLQSIRSAITIPSKDGHELSFLLQKYGVLN